MPPASRPREAGGMTSCRRGGHVPARHRRARAGAAVPRPLRPRTRPARARRPAGRRCLGCGSRPGGRGQVEPPCTVGQHNWKIDDDYDLACDLYRVEVVAARGASIHRGHAGPGPGSARRGLALLPVGPMAEELRDFEGDVLPLSGTAYTRTVAGRERTLGIRWTAHGATSDSLSYRRSAGRLEAVAHPAHGADRRGAELAAQVADVDVHHVRPRIEVVAPHVVEELLA